MPGSLSYMAMVRWRRVLPWAVAVWALGYGALRFYWILAGAPSFGPLGTDLLVYSGWPSVVACAAAGAVAVALATTSTWHAVPVWIGWIVAASLVASCPLLLIDVVGLLIPGLGLPFHFGAFASRVVCLTGALALARCLVDYRRRAKGGCPRCGRTGPARPQTEDAAVQTWAWWAAYAAIAGFGLRLLAQALVGMDQSPLVPGSSMLIFEAGFVLAGVLLPLALVHSWGRTWPRWVPLLAGRQVPRALLLIPAAAVGGGLSVYFGVGTAQLAVETVTGTWNADAAGNLPLWFFWLAMPAYLLWSIALLAAAFAYQRRTSRPCKECGRQRTAGSLKARSNAASGVPS